MADRIGEFPEPSRNSHHTKMPQETARSSRPVRIGRHLLGEGNPCYVIAEAGSNHDGSLKQAKALVWAAAEAGADAVKFQSFTAAGLLARELPDSGCGRSEHPAFATLERLSLPEQWHATLAEESKEHGIDFLSTPFEEGRVDLLEKLHPPAYKVASGDLTHRTLLRKLARTGRTLILSTGLATEQEVADALAWVRKCGSSPVVLLHCVGLYPPPAADLNLRAIPAMRSRFGIPCGFSDHTNGIWASLGAVALGAVVLEKHFTLDRSLEGPDHAHSIEPATMKQLIQEIRCLEQGLGDGIKRPAPGEKPERFHARRGSYAARTLRRGESLRVEDLLFLRPANGMSPEQAVAAAGRRLVRELREMEPVTAQDLEPEGHVEQ